jgi:hypothetical protein
MSFGLAISAGSAPTAVCFISPKRFSGEGPGISNQSTEIENAWGFRWRQAAASVAWGSEDSTRIVAYIEKEPAITVSIKNLREQLSLTLPSYMIPSIFMFLERLPISANGKLDRNALPDPPQNRPELDTAYVPPKTGLEHRLAQIWIEIFSLDQIGTHDNFFELGGDSLMATRLISNSRRL